MVVTVKNNPYIKLDANGRAITDSSDDMAFRGEYSGTNLIYSGFARPGADEGDEVWQISKHTYDVNDNLVSSIWPQDANAHASSEYMFSWTDRATYTYS